MGGVYAILSMLIWIWPSGTREDPAPGNSSAPDASLVAGFARDFVTTYLTAKSGDEQKLARYVTLRDFKLPTTGAAFTDADVAFVKQKFITGDGVAVWSATVSGVVNGATTAKPQRTFYRVPITVFDGAPRATGLPMQVTGPDVGVDLKLGYRNDVSAESELGKNSVGFLRSYLTGGDDFALHTTTDFHEKPIRPAPYRSVEAIKIMANVANDGRGATTAEVYVTVRARANNNATTELAYPLTLRSVEGSWRVEAIPSIPLLQLRPDAPNDNETTTSAPTTTTPTPTRG